MSQDRSLGSDEAVSAHGSNHSIKPPRHFISQRINIRQTLAQIAYLRDLVMKTRGQDMPIVIVGNKTDTVRELDRVEVESVVQCDWENGYVECSAMFNNNISAVFKELLNQARSELIPAPAIPLHDNRGSSGLLMPGHTGNSSLHLRRRQSLPVVPVFNKPGEGLGLMKRREGRRGSVAVTNLAKQSACKIS